MERNRREFLTGAAWMGVAAIDFPDYTRGGWKTAKPFAVDEIEGTLSERAYSYRVLPMLKEKYGEIAFLIGGDSLLAFDSWRNPEEVAKICPLIVVPRADESLDELRAKAIELGLEGPYTSFWHMFGWNTLGLPAFGPMVATQRFFDTLNRVEIELNRRTDNRS